MKKHVSLGKKYISPGKNHSFPGEEHIPPKHVVKRFIHLKEKNTKIVISLENIKKQRLVPVGRPISPRKGYNSLRNR